MVGFDNQLRLDMSLIYPTTELSVGYGPRLSLAHEMNAAAPWSAVFLHEGELGFAVYGERDTLSLRQSFTFGTQSFAQIFSVPQTISAPRPGATPSTSPSATAAAASAATPVSPAPSGTGDLVPLQSLKVWGESTSLAYTHRFSPRWESAVDAGFGVSGGREGDQAFLPLLHTGDAGVALDHQLTRHHSLGGVLRGEHGWSNRGNFWLVELAGTWGIQFSRHTEAGFRAGAAYRNSRDFAAPRTSSFVPVVSGALSQTVDLRGSRALFSFFLGYDPGVDVINATLANRVTALASASWATTEDALTLAITGSQSFGGDDVRFLGATLSWDHQLLEWLAWQLGGQVADQDAGDSPLQRASSGGLWTVFAGLSATTETLHF
ncbi:MAG TPA: hypothetical protein VJR89_29160 [Polyangiales bacterium]|nr:hypothetical protein [Polyangiales bacterium]